MTDSRDRRRRREQRKAADLRKADYMWLMDSPAGRRLVWSWLELAGIYRTTFTGTRQGDFLEGRRSIGLEILNEVLTHAPGKYPVMQTEQLRPTKQDERTDESDPDGPEPE